MATPNPLDEMNWEDRFMYAFRSVLVLENRLEDALALLKEQRPEIVILHNGDQVQKLRERHQIRQLRKEGVSYRNIAKRIQQLRKVI
jgi:predicted MPP superfamily phosphohydrolase